MAFNMQVRKWGNSLAIRIPKPLAEDIQLREGTIVELSVEEGRFVASPLPRRRYSLDELVQGITKANRHAATDMGGPAGREVW